MLKRFATVAAALVIGLSLPASAMARVVPDPNTSPVAAVTNHVWRDGIVVTTATPVISIYKVRGGDTLSEIARKNNLKWKGLYCENKRVIGNDPNMILPGMKLKLKNSEKMCRIAAPKLNGTNLPAVNAVPVQQTQTVSSYSASSGSFQQCVIMAESGGNPRAINPSSGASGLYGFLLSTWDSLGLGYPGGAYTAPVSVQNEGFQILYARDGTSPWAPYDGC